MYKIGSSCRGVVGAAVNGSFRRAVVATSVRSLFITTDSPKVNPHFMKFTLDREVLPKVYGPQWPISHYQEEMIAAFPLAANIFKIADGTAIQHVFFTRTYINVTKHKELSWVDLEPAVRDAILDFYANPRAEFELEPPPYEPDPEDDEWDIKRQIKANVKHAVRCQRDRDGYDSDDDVL